MMVEQPDNDSPEQVTAAPAPAVTTAVAATVGKRVKLNVDKASLQAIARPAGAVALIFLALFLAWQAWLLRAEQQATTDIVQAISSAKPLLEKPIKAAKERFATAVADPALLQHLKADGERALESTAATLRGSLADATEIAVYAPDAGVLVGANAAKLGYVRAAQLARAQSDGQGSIDAVREAGGKQAFSIVQPIRDGDAIAAFAAGDLSLDPLKLVFDGLSLPDGRFELRLGNNDKSPVVLTRGQGSSDQVEASTQLGDSGLWLTATTPVAHAWLPASISPLPLWLLAFLALGGAAALAWNRKVVALQQRLQARRGGGGLEPTFAEVIAGNNPAHHATTETPEANKPAASVTIDRSIFRAYDIRGVVGKSLNADVARLIGQAIGSAARERGQHEIVVGRDGRLSGPELSTALIAGLRASGMDVIDIGQAPTPVVYFACYQLNTGSGVALTGSHNPPDYNGFKIVLGGETLAEEAIQDLYARIAEGRLENGSGGLRQMDVGADYIERIASDVQAERPLKVVVDCGNGVAGMLAPQVLQAVGCEITPLYAEVDGNFPNHHPDPSDPHNLEDLILSVKHKQADLGIAFDGDGDRLGVVTREGEIIYPDRLLMLFATDVLIRDPGATIIYDVKCTGHLQSVILRHGGSPLMWKTGHSLIKSKMRETNAALAGEMSGHFFFRERWYGFDDGIYAAARLLEILAGDLEGRSPEEVFRTLPNGVSTPELKIPLEEGEHYRFIERFRKKARFEDARITTIDGLRADWPDGWGLVRASNTTPVLVLRFDADSDTALKRIQGEFRRQLLAVDGDLKLPF
ncbi:MAG TPA: phosphomannomutase/phosphoglucomutase [Rhodanobacteraceae bacterium]|nr:phosphomannomutase/phosphoglucomutase [Rhodanobacteraceae bacterium]